MLWIITIDYGKTKDTAHRGMLKVFGETEEDARRAATLQVQGFEYVNIVRIERDRSRA